MALSDDEQKEINEKFEKHSHLITEIRIEQARQDGKVNDLLGWREQFTEDIKETLRVMDNKWDRERVELFQVVRNIDDKMDKTNKKMDETREDTANKVREAGSKLPSWGVLVISTLSTVAGWFVSWAIYAHK